MDRKEKVEELFFNGCNCAQAVVCAYAEEYGMNEETAYRIAEGFGSGIVGLESVCGAISGMIMVTSLRNCLKKDIENPSRLSTYEQVNAVVNEFKKRMGAVDCTTLKQKDETMIQGKRKCCLDCVLCACDILEEK